MIGSSVEASYSFSSDVSLLVSVLILISLVMTVMTCLCCYSSPSDDDESIDGLLLEQYTDKYLTSSSSSSYFPSATSVRLQSDLSEKDVMVSKVQPDVVRQWSVNKRLGANNLPMQTATSSSEAAVGDESDILPLSGLHFSESLMPDIAPLSPHLGSESLGRLQFHIGYDFRSMTLNLKLISAEDLPAKDFSGTSDPYVKIMLLPDRKHQLVSNIKRKNLNPRWNEMFAFEGYPFAKLSAKTLYMKVLDYDRFSRDDPIGEVCIPLSDIDLANGEALCQELQSCKGHAGKLGELLMSLCYQPVPGLINVGIVSARSLKAKDLNGLSDPYVKIWLLYEGKKVEKQKTQVKHKTTQPTFNESFVFNVSCERIRRTALSIFVMDYDHIGRNELIGRVVVGSRCGPNEMKHWNDMLAKPRIPIERWHVLKDFD